MSRKDYERALIKELASHGIERVSFTYGRRHPAVTFEWQGKTLQYRFPGSASDWRAVQNSLCDVRKLLGVERVTNKTEISRERRQQRQHARKRCEPAQPKEITLSVKADPFAALKALIINPVITEE